MLRFKLQRDYQIGASSAKPVNENLLLENKNKVNAMLSKYIDRINATKGYILISVGSDGETFSNQPIDIPPPLFDEIAELL